MVPFVELLAVIAIEVLAILRDRATLRSEIG